MRSLLLSAAVGVAALGLLSATASNANAQWLPGRFVTSSYVPVTSYYYAPAPVVVTPAPAVTTYYSPVTYSSYYPPVTYSSYYAPVAAPVIAAPVPPVAVYRPAWIFRPRVVYRY